MTSDNPASARPRRRPGENRERLIEAGLIEFGLFGYHGASTSGIGARAEVPQPHLYASFPSKRELFLATVRRVAQQLGQRASDASDGRLTSTGESNGDGSTVPVALSGGRTQRLVDGSESDGPDAAGGSNDDVSARVLLQAVALAGDAHLGPELHDELSKLRSDIGSNAFDQLLLRAAKLLLPQESAGK